MAVVSSIASSKTSKIFHLIWLDASVNDFDHNYQVQQHLRTLINRLRTFESVDVYEQYIQSLSKEDRIFLITNGQLGRQIVSHINQLQQISSIYVYCMNKNFNDEWAKQYSNFCKRYYKKDQIQLNNIQEFENNYTSDKALWWNTKTIRVFIVY
ncbi:unnamed protein product [Rotaria sp. Silwood1]|nr:unnamed protein product [Rotaria sp. Silwood1]CAF1180788.1 unnamed protein product [Rotaria sp. Silwood1]CAF3435717.1 unnamed protein product [Rotaria sp. Silwood1]CAF3456658.1 unnamed protein product [Rotaria sp. Silwood1]CAF3494015.1 unnamed protein product [Rotaria sp. Silwood1]